MLAAGNFINGGTKKGGKHGFELETLSKIGGYKTTDNSMSILGFIFKFLNLHYPDALSWIDEMAALPKVIRIETDNLDAMLTAIDKKLSQIEGLLAVHDEKEEEDRFHGVMTPFHSDAKVESDFDEICFFVFFVDFGFVSGEIEVAAVGLYGDE